MRSMPVGCLEFELAVGCCPKETKYLYALFMLELLWLVGNLTFVRHCTVRNAVCEVQYSTAPGGRYNLQGARSRKVTSEQHPPQIVFHINLHLSIDCSDGPQRTVRMASIGNPIVPFVRS